MNDVFYVFEGAETTYAAFSVQVAHRARALPECRGDVVALLAGHGPDFVINLFALWKAGAIPFLVSTRVPWEMAMTLMDAAGARLLITDKVESPDRGRPSLRVVSAACERESGRVRDDTTLPEPPGTGAVILHTSGTTSSPGLVRFSSTTLLASLSFEEAAWDGLWTRRDASLGWLPLYHAFGLISELLYAYRVGSRYYFSEANPRALLAKLEQEPITIFSSVPWMLEQISCMPGGLAALARLRWVVAGGAVISPELGCKLVAAGVRLVQQYGMTELGATLRGFPGGDWRDLLPVIPARYWRLEHGTGQLMVQRDCPIFGELATRDIFDCATSGGLRYRNRVDDVLVHVNGEKSNALAIERILLARAGDAIDCVVVAGSGRRRPACVVVWKQDPPTADDRDALRRAIDQANSELPRHSQLHHELVLALAPSERVRIPLSPKGTVIRTAVEDVFRKDLDELYRDAEAVNPTAGSRPASDVLGAVSSMVAKRVACANSGVQR
jgi:long-subunit acyl-CoA synthetase (AMP-forming)